VPYLAITFPISLMFAVASWFIVERTFLNFKRLKLPTLWRPPTWWGEKVQGKTPAVRAIPPGQPDQVGAPPRDHADPVRRQDQTGRAADDQPDLSSAPTRH